MCIFNCNTEYKHWFLLITIKPIIFFMFIYFDELLAMDLKSFVHRSVACSLISSNALESIGREIPRPETVDSTFSVKHYYPVSCLCPLRLDWVCRVQYVQKEIICPL